MLQTIQSYVYRCFRLLISKRKQVLKPNLCSNRLRKTENEFNEKFDNICISVIIVIFQTMCSLNNINED